MKYEQQSASIQSAIASSQNILIALSKDSDADTIASGLALYLSLVQSKHQVSIATESSIRVGHSQLYGVGQIQDKLPQAGGGNFMITLGGVAVPDPNGGKGDVPSLEKVDYETSGTDLNLVFFVKPGQQFNPTAITPHYQTSFDTIFVLGAADLTALGNMYSSNQQVFSGAQIINIDKNGQNTQFGTINLVDAQSSSLSEIIASMLFDLGMPVDNDTSTNILSGIFANTNNLTGGNIGPDTFMVVAEAMRRGGQRPGAQAVQAAPAPVSQPEPTPVAQPAAAAVAETPTHGTTDTPVAPSSFDFGAVFGGAQPQGGNPLATPQSNFDFAQAFAPQPATPAPEALVPTTVPEPTPVAQPAAAAVAETPTHGTTDTPVMTTIGTEKKIEVAQQDIQPSAEERPSGERAISDDEVVTPEPDWLTPKVFKGSSLG